MTRKQVNDQNATIIKLLNECETEIAQLEGNDDYISEHAKGRWIDRRTALITALEVIA